MYSVPVLVQILALLPHAVNVAAGFTPSDLLGAPQTSRVVPNRDGTLGLYLNTTYSLSVHSSLQNYYSVNLTSGETLKLFEDDDAINEVLWLGADSESLLFTMPADGGMTELRVKHYRKKGLGYRAMLIPGSPSYFRAAANNDTVFLAFLALQEPNACQIYDEKKVSERLSNGTVYNEIPVRIWNSYVKPEKPSLFSAELHNQNGVYFTRNYTCLIPPHTGLSDIQTFSLSPNGKDLAFIADDPLKNKALHSSSYVYHISHDGTEGPQAINAPLCYKGYENVPEGLTSELAFSPDGNSIAYIQMDEDGTEYGLNKVYIVKREGAGIPRLVLEDPDLNVQGLEWATDGRSLYLSVDHLGALRPFYLSLDDKNGNHTTQLLKNLDGSLEMFYGIKPLPGNKKLLLMISSFKDPQQPYLLDLQQPDKVKPILPPSPASKALANLNVSEFWYKGAKADIHAWMVKPSSFDAKKKYPLCFWIHGGPQSSSTNSWSYGMNVGVFAESGCIVVLPNPTGSTGFGQDFVDAVKQNWGGDPYTDLVLAIKHIETDPAFSFIDTSNMAAMGASYGGYMINWINGHPLGRKFKTMVNHAGLFYLINHGSDDIMSEYNDFGTSVIYDRTNFEKWDPSLFVDEWNTPTMVIHNEKDYRVPVTEGIATFNALQEMNVPSRFLTFDDEGHHIENAENLLVWYTEVLKWTWEWLGDKTAGKEPAVRRVA